MSQACPTPPPIQASGVSDFQLEMDIKDLADLRAELEETIASGPWRRLFEQINDLEWSIIQRQERLQEELAASEATQ